MPMQAGSAPDMHLNSRRHLTDHLYLEPDENWKQQTRKEIEPELWPLVEEARARCTHLSPYPPDSVAMKAMTMQYEQTMAYICNVAETTYRERLERERESRKSSPYAYMNEHDLAQYLATPRFAERVSSSATSPDQAQDAAITGKNSLNCYLRVSSMLTNWCISLGQPCAPQTQRGWPVFKEHVREI